MEYRVKTYARVQGKNILNNLRHWSKFEVFIPPLPYSISNVYI